MFADGNVIDVSARGAMACALGIAISFAQPALIPGVTLMCIFIFGFDL